MVTNAGDDHGPLVRLTSTGALGDGTGGDVTMLNQSRAVLLLLRSHQPQQHSPVIEKVDLD